jgi:hypothetical protein
VLVLLLDVLDRLDDDSLAELSSSRSVTIETRRFWGCSGRPKVAADAGNTSTAGLADSRPSNSDTSHTSTRSWVFSSHR